MHCEENSPNDAVVPCQYVSSYLEKRLQFLQQMSQQTAAKYDYHSSEVTELPRLLLNIKDQIKTVQINRGIYIEQGIVSAEACS